jgi:catecholate siderophore receptor
MQAAGVAVTALLSARAPAEGDAPDQPPLPSVEVTGTAIASEHDNPQAIDKIDAKALADQNLTLLTDALRNVPGVTLNAGEGGAHGDSINLRGLSVPDSFFQDGIRDIGQYQRDTFNADAISVLLGPASVLFGRGSTAGIINTISKQPRLTPLAAVNVSAGQGDYWRGTGDFNWVLSDTAAARLAVMDQRNGVVQRDQVLYRRYGVAPTFAFGIDTPTRVTLSFFRQSENDIPDYGIPFLDGAPAAVERSNYYGLINYDRTRTNVNIGSVRVEHDFADELSVSDTVRYASYGFEYLLSAPHLDNDFTAPPAPGTPLADILDYRDQPSSAGTTTELINRTDVGAKFASGGVVHTLTGGLEASRELNNVTRFANGIDDIPGTPLLSPAALFAPPTPLTAVALPRSRGSDVSVFATDSVAFGAHWDVAAGVRWDRFDEHFSEALSASAFARTDTELSPRAALIFKPDAAQSYYLSYGTSYNPAIEYLVLAPSDTSLSPEKDRTLEVGMKLKVLGGQAEVTGALFDTTLTNARIADPDDPTIQQRPFDQRVRGAEFGFSGYVVDEWEVSGSYTHLHDRITATTDPLALGKVAPNAPHDALNVWTTVEPTDAWKLGGGFTAVSHRYADTDNTAGVPGYVVWNAMTSYQLSEHCKLQLNLNNVTDKLYFTGVYYSAVDENHAQPSAGRTLIGALYYRF